MKVANEILRQLGGGRFLAMTGVKNPAGGENFIQFKLPKAVRNKINFVKITLNNKDLYDIEFFYYRAMQLKPVDTVEDVYFDQLRGIFEEYTGYATSL